jgi:hypothetical protein
LIDAVEAEETPDASILPEMANTLRSLTPALIEEVRLAGAGALAHAAAVNRLAASHRGQGADRCRCTTRRRRFR